MRRNILLFGVLTLIGCGGPPPPRYGSTPTTSQSSGAPGWVDGRPGRYNEMEYLTGVGRGAGRGACEEDARAAVAKIFEARISQVASDWQGYFSRVSGAKPEVHVEAMSISQLTRVSTDRVLKGVKLVDHYQDSQGNHHCLAALERLPAAASLREEIALLDQQIRQKMEQGDKAATPTERFMAYARAMEMLQEREAKNEDLRIVDPRGAGAPPVQSWEDLVAKFEGARATIKIGILLKGTKAATVQTCLAEALTAEGFQVIEGSSDVDVMIHGQLKYEKAGVTHGSEMVRADVNLRVTDVESGRTVAAWNETVKEGRPELQQSIQLALTKLCKQAMPELVKKIRQKLSR